MTDKELNEILHNIPQEIFKNNNEKFHSVIHSIIPRLGLVTSKGVTELEVTLYKTMQYRIWYHTTYKDIANQIKSYLEILGFTEKPQTMYSASARYTPEIAVAINSTMADTEIMKLMRHEIANQMFDSLQKK